MARQLPSDTSRPAPKDMPSEEFLMSGGDAVFPAYQYSPRRSRGFISQLITVLLQPVYFFRSLPPNRQWVLTGLLVLAITGYNAVRQTDTATSTNDETVIPFADDTGFDTSGQAPVIGGGRGEVFGGAAPDSFDGSLQGDSGFPPVTDAETPDTRETTTTALIAAGGVVIAWVIQALLLCEISLFRGRAPTLGRNLQIAVWASVPLALMIAIRLIYYAAGGEAGDLGLTPLIEEWDGYTALSPMLQNIVYSLLSSLTLFWLWNVILLYSGARYALNGNFLTAGLVVIQWIILAVVLPVITGAITAPDPTLLGL